MFVAQARYDRVRRLYEGEAAKRQEAEQLAEKRADTIADLNELLAEFRNEQTDATGTVPTPRTPSDEETRLRQQLRLSEKARGALEQQLLDMQRVNEAQARQLRNRVEGSAA